MGLLTFKGGIHPDDGKKLSKDKPIVKAIPGKELVYPLSQHIGAPANPIVEAGARVLRGEKIAEAGGFVSAPVYSAVSGTVKAIAPRVTSTGAKVNSIIIENDEQYEEAVWREVIPLEQMKKEEILNCIAEAGIVGMGGAGFPTRVKLSPKEPEKIEYIIANCAECEPYITADYRRMLEMPEKLVSGMKVVLQLFEHAKGIFGIEDNKPDCIAKLTEMVKDEPRIEVCTLKTKYPQGAERCLIAAVSGREINSSMLPADAGCVVDNIDTVCAVYRAVMFGEPVMDRIVTITGDAVADPCNFKVRLGASFAELLEAAGGLKQPAEKIISGGPMMGFAMFDYHVPVVKTSSAMLCMSKDEVSAQEPGACINCGRCVSACPARLIPSRLATYSEHGQEDLFVKYHGMECVECGCCSYTCPAKRPLTQSVRSMRKTVLANRKKPK